MRGLGATRLLRLHTRSLSTSLSSQEIIFRKIGNPGEVLELVETSLPLTLKPNEVAIKILATPVNPADLNSISGTYGIIPPLPAVPGLEGVGRIIDVGSQVSKLKVGDRAILSFRNWGTWRTHQICPDTDLMKIPDSMSTLNAATIFTNPGTALRMLSDFVDLKKGDTIIQNSANSGVGQAVIQIAKDMGVRSINVIRNRPDVENLKSHLMNLGADCVITDEELRLPKTKDVLSQFSSPSLALNGTGGKILSDMLKYVSDEGTVVTYGGMSRQPVTAPTSALIFRDISFRGFWFNRWVKSRKDQSEITKMIERLFEIASRNNLKPPASTLVPFSEFKKAISSANEPFSGKKQILVSENIE